MRYHVTYTQITIGSYKFFGLKLFAKQNAKEADKEGEGGQGGGEGGEGEELFEQEM